MGREADTVAAVEVDAGPVETATAVAGWRPANANAIHAAARRGTLFGSPSEPPTATARAVFLAQSLFAITSPIVWPSNGLLQQLTGLARRTIQRALRELTAIGYDRPVRFGGLADGKRLASEYELRVPTRATQTPQVSREDAGGVARPAPHSHPARATQTRDPRQPDAPSLKGKPEEKPRKAEAAHRPSGQSRESQDRKIREAIEAVKIVDYLDIAVAADLAAVASVLTGEREPKQYVTWAKRCREIGTKAFQTALLELYGEIKAGECDSPGAILNLKVRKAKGA